MDHTEKYDLNEEARRPEPEQLFCDSCYTPLSDAEAEDPATIKTPIKDTKLFIERIVCDNCGGEHEGLSYDMTGYDKVARTYRHSNLRYI